MARGIRERATVEDVAIFLSMGVMIAISRSGAANEKARDAESTRPKRVCSTCGQSLSYALTLPKRIDSPLYDIFQCVACGLVEWVLQKPASG